MTQEQKQLLLKDLCARLPYGVIFNYGNYSGLDYELHNISQTSLNDSFPIVECKPYLRPMSSMTKVERLIYEQRFHDVGRSIDVIDADDVIPHIDWLNANYFDYRGLIDKGLAIDCTNLNIY